MKQIDYVCDCPGGWYGCNPDQWGRGHVVVDGAKVVEAVRWLSKRVKLISSKTTTDEGVCLGFVLREKAFPEVIALDSADSLLTR